MNYQSLKKKQKKQTFKTHTQKVFGVFITVQTVSHIRNIAIVTSSPKNVYQSFRLSPSRMPGNLSVHVLVQAVGNQTNEPLDVVLLVTFSQF